jgi:hypothetical protein
MRASDPDLIRGGHYGQRRHPALVEVVTGSFEKFAWILPKAVPPVPYEKAVESIAAAAAH